MRKYISLFINRGNIPILLILAVAFVTRIVGVNFALPLWIVGDEPAIIFGPLKMIELHSIIPALHFNEFAGKFYYMPFVAYVYIIPFLLILGFKFLFFYGTFGQFKDFLQLDLSSFFLIARLMSNFFGVMAVYMVYRISLNIFKDKRAALLSSAFLSLSLLHIIFSHWSRHWALSVLVFCLVLYFLSHSDYGKEKRYFIASLICGIGVGMMLEISLVPVFMVLWFFFYDKLNLLEEVKTKWFWSCVFVFFALFISASLIWPKGPYFFKLNNNTAISGNVADSLIGGPAFYFIDSLRRETTLIVFFLVGLVMSFFKFRRYFIPVILSMLFYTFIFYYVFEKLSRLLLLFYPLIVMTAGYGLYCFFDFIKWRKSLVGIFLILIFAPLAVNAFLFDALLVRNDTRIQVIEWVNKNIPVKSKVLVLVPLLRLPSTKESIDEAEGIDPLSLRNIEKSERALGDEFFKRPRFNALNLNAVVSDAFYADLPNYIISKRYDYIIFDQMFAKEKGVMFDLGELGAQMADFAGENVLDFDDPNDGEGLSMNRLLRLSNLGPNIKIIKVDIKE